MVQKPNRNVFKVVDPLPESERKECKSGNPTDDVCGGGFQK